MDLDTITMDPVEAAEKAASYRILKVPDDEELGLVAAFTALAAGKQIVNLPDVIRAGGHDDRLRPRLAVLGTSWRWCYLYRDRDGGVEYRASQTSRARAAVVDVGKVMPVAELRPDEWSWGSDRGDVRCQVPMVPPEHRMWGWKSMLVLWEVEEWAKEPRPPGDPALLRHVVGDLYTVEATWDLTELERMVLGARS